MLWIILSVCVRTLKKLQFHDKSIHQHMISILIKANNLHFTVILMESVVILRHLKSLYSFSIKPMNKSSGFGRTDCSGARMSLNLTTQSFTPNESVPLKADVNKKLFPWMLISSNSEWTHEAISFIITRIFRIQRWMGLNE